MKNKKGSVDQYILVGGVLALCIAAIASFSFSLYSQKRSFGVEIFEEVYSDLDKFYFYLETDASEGSYLDKLNNSALKIGAIIKQVKTQEGKEYTYLEISKKNSEISINYLVKLENSSGK